MAKNKKNERRKVIAELDSDERLIQEMASLEIEGKLSENEIALTKECAEIRKKLSDMTLSEDEKKELNATLNEKRKELEAARNKFDKAIEIFSNLKTPYYTSNVSKRGNLEKNKIDIRSGGCRRPIF